MGRRVLIADSNTDSAESLALLLGMFGHQTVTAHSGPEVLTQAASFHPEVAFLSLHLPQMNGYEVCRKLCSGNYGARPRLLIALTGDGSERDRRASLEAGFDHHLLKPAPPDAILALLKEDSHDLSSTQLPQLDSLRPSGGAF
jgi:CheY-like chemotaxis protein